MTTPTAPRPSTSVAFRIADAVGGGIYRLIGGAVLFVPGGFFLATELRHNYGCDEALRTVPIGIAVALMVAGALVITPSLGGQLTSIFVTVFPNGLPLFGGRRSTDPQPPVKP